MRKGDTLSNDDDGLQSPLREAVDAVCAEATPSTAIERAVARALKLAAPPARDKDPSEVRRRPWLADRRRWLVLAVGAAAMLVVGIFWNHLTGSVLAQMAKAVAERPWMRATGKGPNGTEIEMWYSAPNGIIAVRQEEVVRFINLRERTIEVYEDTGEGASLLSRLPIEKEQQKLFASQERTFQTLFFGNPIKAFQEEPQELLSHTQRTIRDSDGTLIEHRFTTKSPNGDQRTDTVLRVDPKSQLPVYWEAMAGKRLVLACRVEFPTDGPQSIYGMGVPQDVEIVDLAPSEDLQGILAAWRAGRTRFDSYRAVVVESMYADHRAGGYLVTQVWRKGLKWRVEQLRTPPNLDRFHAEGVLPVDANPTAWWLACGWEWETMPKTVSNGTLEIRLAPVYAQPSQEDPNNPKYKWIKSLEPERTNTFTVSTEDPRPNEIGLMPEFSVYPILSGRGGWHFQTTVEPRPAIGPKGTVLVEHLERSSSKLPGRSRGARYWADPARGYVVRQVQWLRTGEPDDSTRGLVEMQQLAVSPSGLWYPLVVRHVQNSRNMSDGTVSDSYVRYYLDFEADIPDELFDVHQWGPIK